MASVPSDLARSRELESQTARSSPSLTEGVIVKSLCTLAVALFVSVMTLASAYSADKAGCAAALTEATQIRDGSGLWLGEARMLKSRRTRVLGTNEEEGWKQEYHDNGLKYGALNQRIVDLQRSLFALRKTGPCDEDGAIEAAIDKANHFLSTDASAKRAPLPEGMCPSSPDLDAPLIPCPPAAGQ
jgi:hypothetical protein